MCNTLELRVLGSTLAEGRGRDNAVNVESIPGVLSVCNSVGNQSVFVSDTLGFGEVDHGISVVLLSTGVGVGEQRVDSVNTSELDTRVTSLGVTTALHTEILPALSDLAEIILSDTLSNTGLRTAAQTVRSFSLGSTGRRGSGSTSTNRAWDRLASEHSEMMN